eukprot:g3774.t1
MVKFLQVASLERAAARLRTAQHPNGGAHQQLRLSPGPTNFATGSLKSIDCRIEAFSCKMVAEDKKLLVKMEAQYLGENKDSTNTNSSPSTKSRNSTVTSTSAFGKSKRNTKGKLSTIHSSKESGSAKTSRLQKRSRSKERRNRGGSSSSVMANVSTSLAAHSTSLSNPSHLSQSSMKDSFPTSSQENIRGNKSHISKEPTRLVVDSKHGVRLLTNLVLTMNLAFPDYDFSHYTPSNFVQHANYQSVIASLNTVLSPTHVDLASLNATWSDISDFIDLPNCDIFSYKVLGGDEQDPLTEYYADHYRDMLAQHVSRSANLVVGAHHHQNAGGITQQGNSNLYTSGGFTLQRFRGNDIHTDDIPSTVPLWTYNYFFYNRTKKQILFFGITCHSNLRQQQWLIEQRQKQSQHHRMARGKRKHASSPPIPTHPGGSTTSRRDRRAITNNGRSGDQFDNSTTSQQHHNRSVRRNLMLSPSSAPSRSETYYENTKTRGDESQQAQQNDKIKNNQGKRFSSRKQSHQNYSSHHGGEQSQERHTTDSSRTSSHSGSSVVTNNNHKSPPRPSINTNRHGGARFRSDHITMSPGISSNSAPAGIAIMGHSFLKRARSMSFGEDTLFSSSLSSRETNLMHGGAVGGDLPHTYQQDLMDEVHDNIDDTAGCYSSGYNYDGPGEEEDGGLFSIDE